MKKKDIALSVCIALTAPNIASAESFSGIAALNLGDIKSSSYLDEPFRGSIPILYTTAKEASQLRVGLASNAIFKEFDIEDQAILSKLKFQIVVRNGQPYVDIRSTQAINLPFLSFVIEIFSPEGSIYQEYTVLLDPRNYAQSTNTTSSAKVAPVKRNLSSEIVNQRPTRVKVNSGDTLSSIANSVKLRGISNKSMSQAIFLSNSRAFSGNNPNKLKKGVTLKIPTASDVRTIQKTGKKIEAKKVSKKSATASKKKTIAPKIEVDGNSTQTYLVKGGDTLSGIARKFTPASESFSEVMKAIHLENPHAFTNNKVNLLQKGATLQIPVFETTDVIADSSSTQKSSKKAKTKSQKPKNTKAVEQVEDEFSGNHYKVMNGDTLGSIVNKLEYKDISSSKLMEAIFTANPNAFEKDNITVIKAGSIIRLPSNDQIHNVKTIPETQPVETAETSVEQTINHSLDRLEKRLREIRTELKTTQAQLFDLNLTLKNKDILIKRQAKDISILKKKLAKVEVADQTVTNPPNEFEEIANVTRAEEVNFSTLANLIASDIKREKSLTDTITYSGIAILLGLIAVRIGRQRYADHIVQSEDYVPIAKFEPQIINENLDFKKTLTDTEVNNTVLSEKSFEESERLVDELVDELNNTVEEMQEQNNYNEPTIEVTEIKQAETTPDQTEEPYFEQLEPLETSTETIAVNDNLEEEKASGEIEPDFDLIKTPLVAESSTSSSESAVKLKTELLSDLEGKVEPSLNYTNRAQYQSHYGLEATEIDLEKRLQSINDEINIKNMEEEV